MLGLSLWEGRLPGQKTIENEDKAAMGSYRPESNFGTKRHRDRLLAPTGRLYQHFARWLAHPARSRSQLAMFNSIALAPRRLGLQWWWLVLLVVV